MLTKLFHYTVRNYSHCDLIGPSQILAMLRPVHNIMQRPMLHCVMLAFELAATQRNARIDSDPILAAAFLRLVTKNREFVNIFALRKLNATQRMRPCVIL